jgi:Flp pilus assembly protein TadD
MSQLNAFVGHSFADEDREVVEAFLKFLNQVKGMGIGFTWESAEPAEPKELADKVKGLIRDKNLFIGICTRKEAAIEPARLSRSRLNRRVFKANEEHFSWKTSDWIIQEIGLAIGRRMDLILLVESGLRQPGGLQGNLEYIPFERSTPEKSFGKLLEMIRALLPKAKAVPMPEAEISAVSEEKPRVEETEGSELLEPRADWTREDYELALLRAIMRGNAERARGVTESYFATDEGQIPANRQSWEAWQEHVRIVFGEGGTLRKLQELADKYPDNGEVHRYLALAYRHYEEHEKAGQCFVVAAERTADERSRLLMHRDAMVDFAQARRKEDAKNVLYKMKLLLPQVADGETIVINALRQLKDIENSKDLFFGLIERLLQLHPDDVKARFTLAYNYSQADQDELSFYHYLKIPYQERNAITWNNLGVQLDHFDLASKSVDAYRTAENLGETLAMSNLARKLIKAGFLKEAQEICNRALQVKDYHKNVGYVIQQIKSIPEEEDNKQREVSAKAMPLSEFYRDYGRAAVQKEIPEHNGRWRGPDCELQVTIKGGIFLAEGEYEVQRTGLGLASALLPVPGLAAPPETDNYRIKYSGQIYGHTIQCDVTREEMRKPAVFPSLLSQMRDETHALMVVSDDLSEIRVYEKRSSKEPLFYTLTHLA